VAEDVPHRYAPGDRRQTPLASTAGENYHPATDHVQIRDRHVRATVQGSRLSKILVNPQPLNGIQLKKNK